VGGEGEVEELLTLPFAAIKQLALDDGTRVYSESTVFYTCCAWIHQNDTRTSRQQRTELLACVRMLHINSFYLATVVVPMLPSLGVDVAPEEVFGASLLNRDYPQDLDKPAREALLYSGSLCLGTYAGWGESDRAGSSGATFSKLQGVAAAAAAAARARCRRGRVGQREPRRPARVLLQWRVVAVGDRRPEARGRGRDPCPGDAAGAVGPQRGGVR